MQILVNFIIRYLYKYATLFFELFIKPDKKTVAIIGLRGNTFEGNSKYFFEFLFLNKEFNPIWFSNNKTKLKIIKEKYPNNVAYIYSLNGFLTFIKSQFAICSYSAKNFNPLYISKKKICINLWHGTPMKRIGYQDPSLTSFQKKKLSEDVSFTNYYIASSDYDADVFQQSFQIGPDRVLTFGTPRNDFLINKTTNNQIKDFELLSNSKIILYAPTFRADSKAELLPFSNINLDEINEFLEENNAYLLIRKHHNEAIRFVDLYKTNSIRSRILFAGQNKYPDVQPLLKYTDILITDYSGIYFDFLILDRPIAFAPYDYEEYIKERNFLFDYYKNTPGPKLFSQSDLINFLKDALSDCNFDSKIRVSAIKRFHKYIDGKSCERLLHKMHELKQQ